MVHVLNKGKNGEREIATLLRQIIDNVVISIPNIDFDTRQRLSEVVQRNTNQSSSGGCDIMLFGLAIEVKRQETLNLNAWWTQCLNSAARNDDIPILIWRQNRKPWQVRIQTMVLIPNSDLKVPLDCIISFEDFQMWFYYHVRSAILNDIKIKI